MFVPGVKIPLPLGFIPPCLPSPSQKPPSGSAWVHEIKHDGYRLIADETGGASGYTLAGVTTGAASTSG